jgi:hypothetical protein
MIRFIKKLIKWTVITTASLVALIVLVAVSYEPETPQERAAREQAQVEAQARANDIWEGLDDGSFIGPVPGFSAKVRVLDVMNIGNGRYAVLTNSLWPRNPQAYRDQAEYVYGVKVFDADGNEYAVMNREYNDLKLDTVQAYFDRGNFEIGINFGPRDAFAQLYVRAMREFLS